MGNPSLCHRQCHNFRRSTWLTRSNGRDMPIPPRDCRQHRQPEWLVSHSRFRHLRPSSWRSLMLNMVTATNTISITTSIITNIINTTIIIISERPWAWWTQVSTLVPRWTKIPARIWAEHAWKSRGAAIPIRPEFTRVNCPNTRRVPCHTGTPTPVWRQRQCRSTCHGASTAH